MNPLSTHYLSAELDYRQEQIAEDMAAAAWWSHAIRTASRRAVAAARRRIEGTRATGRAPWPAGEDVTYFDQSGRAAEKWRATAR